MDVNKPHKVQLLGMNIVLWNDGPSTPMSIGGLFKVKKKGNWNAFLDSCPHRRAPLSEGTIEDDGSLLCSYHGWRFQGEADEKTPVSGQCSKLPYSPDRFEDLHRKKACSEVFPTKIVDGMVWVFPQTGLEGIIRSEQRPLPLIRELHDSERKDKDEWQSRRENEDWLARIPAGVRDFPCNFDIMIENTLDPAHFCAAHHGTLGNRYTDPYAFDFKTEIPLSTCDKGFTLDGDMGELEFVPPCLTKYYPDYSAMPFEKNLLLATYCVPTKPGWVRPLATVLYRKEKDGSKKRIDTIAKRALDVFMGPYTPTWFGHIASSIVLHQDSALLYDQYHNMRSMGYYNHVNQNRGIHSSSTVDTDSDGNDEGLKAKRNLGNYQDYCYTPNRVDKGIITFRRWFDTLAEGDVPWASNENGPMMQPLQQKQFYEDLDTMTSNINMLPMQQRLQQHQNRNPNHVSAQQQNVDIYDMWHAHTENCAFCSAVYRRLEFTKKAAFTSAIATAVLPVASEYFTDGQRTSIILAGVGLGVALEKFNELFIRYETHHHD